ncbi:MAG: hypothetical protein IJU86_00645 [Firmicutes bacterium]|nr:hypothetical protein [Bacillota bacterium]
MEDSTTKKEERVKLPEGWNSYNKTWITKDDFKDKKGKEITDIDKKIKKFIELLNNVGVSKFEGGITNFCFRFPDIVKDIFGTECKLQKGNRVTRFWIKDKSTNPFDYKGFCDAIFDFIDKQSVKEAKKQNYCLLLEMIFMKPGFIGSYGNFEYDGTLISIENHVLYIFTQKTWTHMPIISSMFMEKLCSKITNTDIEKYNFKFVLKSENNVQEISKYGSIVINGADIQSIEALNKLKLSYYKALLKNKFNPNESKDFFNTISLYLVDFVCDSNNSRGKIDLIREINQYTNVNNFLNEKQNLQQLESIPNKIMQGALWDQSKLSLLRELFAIIADLLQRTDDKKQYWKLASNAIDCIESIIKTPNNYNKIQWHIDGCLKQIYDVAVFIDPDQAYQKISDLFISVAPSCHVNIFTSFLNLLRGDTEKEPNKYYLDAISSVSEELATNKEIKQAKEKLCEFVEFIRTDPKKNISSDIFQSLFNAINKHFPMSKDNDGCTARCRLLKKLFCDFATANPKAEEVYFEKVETIMDEYQKFLNDNKSQIPFSLYERQNFAEPQINSLIKIVVIGRKKLSNGKVKYKDVMQIVDIIDKSFPSDGEKDKKDRCEAITHLFQLLTKHGLLEAFLFPFDLSFFVEQGVTVVFKTSVTWFKNGWKKFRNQRPKKQMTDFISPKDADKATKSKDKNDTTKSNEKKIEILSYREILPDEINNTVDNYNKELKKEQVNEKFDLDAQVFRDIEKDVIQTRLFELNKIINNNAPEQENPLIGIFRFLSDQQFNLNQFLSIFQCSYLDTVVDLINLPILDYVINKYDVTQEAGKLFESEDKNAEENDKFNQKCAYNPRLKSINKLLINHFIQQLIKAIVKNSNKFFYTLIDGKESLRKKIDEVSQKITSSLLKKFGSVYGIILKIQTAAKNVGEKGEYNTTAAAIFGFVLDFINGGNDDSNLLTLLLELVSEFDFEDLNIEKDRVQLKEYTYDVINFFMGLITFSKALDCDTEIFADGGSENNKKKTTDKLINLLKKIVDTKEFKCFVGKCLSKEYVNKIKQLIDDVAKLKFEDCAYLLCSDEILAQNKENGKNDKDKGDKDKNENTINSINIGSEEDEKNDLFNIDNKNSIKKENKKESKLYIILNQTAMFSWLRKNKHGNTTFFDLRTSLSDEKKIKEFENYKEQIKNDQKEQKNMDDIEAKKNINPKNKIDLNTNEIKKNNQVNNNNIINDENKKSVGNDIINESFKKDQIEKNLVVEKRNQNEIKNELNNDNNNINEINIDTNIMEKKIKNDLDVKNGEENDSGIHSENKPEIEHHNMQIDVMINIESNNKLEQKERSDTNRSIIVVKKKQPTRRKFELSNDNDVVKEVNNINVEDKVKKNDIVGDQKKQNENNIESQIEVINDTDDTNTNKEKKNSNSMNNIIKDTNEINLVTKEINEIKNKDNNNGNLAKTQQENKTVEDVNAKTNNNIENNGKEIRNINFNSINNFFKQNEDMKNENKNIANKESRKRRNSFMFENKLTLDDANEIEIVNQIKSEKNKSKIENNDIKENVKNELDNIERDKSTTNKNSNNIENKIIDNQNNPEEKFNSSNNNDKNIEENVAQKQQEIFDSIKNSFPKVLIKNENKNTEDKTSRKRRDSFTTKNKFTLGNNKIDNQTEINKNGGQENIEVNYNINPDNTNENDKMIKNVIININDGDSKSKDAQENGYNNINQNENNNQNNNQIEEKDNKDEIKDSNNNMNTQIKNVNINNQYKKRKSESNDEKEPNTEEKNLNLGGNNASVIQNEFNPEPNKNKLTFDTSLKNKIKRSFSFSFKKIHRQNIELQQPQQNQNIPITTPSNKKKIIATIIFGIIFVLSVVFLSLALTIEALNFLALVISMAVVATIALIIVIVLAFIIYRDNKKSEPEGLAPTFSFDRNNDDKKITRCNSLDCLKMIEANKPFDPK